MLAESIRIVIDTNLWISFLITNNYRTLDESILSGKIIVLFSEELLDEIIEVICRPKFAKYFTNNDISKLLKVFDTYGIFIDVKSKIELCRDIKDNFLLSLSVDSNADYLITGDKDLLELKKIENTKIITMDEFLKIFKKMAIN